MRGYIMAAVAALSIAAAVAYAQFPGERPGNRGRFFGPPPSGAPSFQGQKPPGMDARPEQGQQPRPESYESSKTDASLAGRHADSPFAFAHAWATGSSPMYNYPEYISDMKDLGVYWVRAAGFYSLNWSRMRPLDGAQRWGQLDSIVKELQYNSVNILLSLNPGAGSAPSEGRRQGMMRGEALPDDLDAYGRFVAEAVERYDMDGTGDMPGLRFPITHYLVGNEPDVPIIWRGTPEDYAVFLRTSYRAIKGADPGAKVVMGGSAGSLFQYLPAGQNPPQGLTDTLRDDGRKGGDGFFVKAMRHLRAISGKEDYKDLVMDFHFYGSAGDWRAVEYFVKYIRKLESDFGFARMPIWVTETGTFSGEISGMVKNDLARMTGQMGQARKQDEAAQASEIVKRHVFGAANGVEKLFWFSIKDGANPIYFENTGLLDSASNKKLSYFAYKKMVEKLEGSDWKRTEVSREAGAYLVRFSRGGKPVWVAWSDGGSASVEIDAGSGKVAVTAAVPKLASGREAGEYGSAFTTEVVKSRGGKAVVSVGDAPVYIEGI